MHHRQPVERVGHIKRLPAGAVLRRVVGPPAAVSPGSNWGIIRQSANRIRLQPKEHGVCGEQWRDDDVHNRRSGGEAVVVGGHRRQGIVSCRNIAPNQVVGCIGDNAQVRCTLEKLNLHDARDGIAGSRHERNVGLAGNDHSVVGRIGN